MTLKQLVKAAVGLSHYNIYIDEDIVLEGLRQDIKFKEYDGYEVDEFTIRRNILNIYLIKKEV